MPVTKKTKMYMSTVLDEIRDKIIEREQIPNEFILCYKLAFDAAIGLELPVRFLEWYEHEMLFGENMEFNEVSKKDYPEIYKYWLTHIYKPI
jgi:hypothetical protein